MILIQQVKNLLLIMDQEILDTYGKTMNAEIGYQVLYQKVVEFVCDNVTINDTSSTEQ